MRKKIFKAASIQFIGKAAAEKTGQGGIDPIWVYTGAFLLVLFIYILLNQKKDFKDQNEELIEKTRYKGGWPRT